MPTLDNFSLGNCGLDGQQQNTPQTLTPAVSESITVNPGFAGNLRTIATIAPSSVISLTVTNAGIGRIVVIPPANSSNILFCIALLDDAGRVWNLVPDRTFNTTLYSLQISELGAYSIYENESNYLTSSTSKAVMSSGMPSNFNLKADMKLCLYIKANTSSTSGNMQLICSNVRIVSV